MEITVISPHSSVSSHCKSVHRYRLRPWLESPSGYIIIITLDRPFKFEPTDDLERVSKPWLGDLGSLHCFRECENGLRGRGQ